MNLANVHIGDVVQCDVKGRRFFAVVRDREPGGLKILPISLTITYRTVTARQVINHYRKSRQGYDARTQRQLTEVGS